MFTVENMVMQTGEELFWGGKKILQCVLSFKYSLPNRMYSTQMSVQYKHVPLEKKGDAYLTTV